MLYELLTKEELIDLLRRRDRLLADRADKIDELQKKQQPITSINTLRLIEAERQLEKAQDWIYQLMTDLAERTNTEPPAYRLVFEKTLR